MSLSRTTNLYHRLRQGRQRAVSVTKRLRSVHPTASVHRTASVSSDLVADEYAYIGPGCLISPLVHVGAYSLLAPRVAVVGADHRTDVVGTPMQFTGRPEQVSTAIGRDVWIGYGAVISRGVTIGDGSVIGAGSIVTKDVPAYEIWAGAPARKLRNRFEAPDYVLHQEALDRGDIRPVFAEPQSQA